MKKCLMIQTKDNKKFFTYEKNLPQLIEFSKVFNAQISTVQIQNDDVILDLEELAPALCEKKTINAKNYEILEVKVKSKERRNEVVVRASNIQKYISENLLRNKTVTLKELSKKYKNLTPACLCNHFRQARENLIRKGYEIIKIGGGKYKIK